MRLVRHVAVFVPLVCAPLVGCASVECTEIGCSDRAVVSYPFDLVDGAYDLVVESERGTLVARCLQAAPPEGPENSPGLDCDGAGFSMQDSDVASSREIRVTITDVDTGELLAEGVDVTLDVVDENAPNGPDCEPVCYERNGQLLVDGLPG
jgi:hypothetical protein